MSDPVSELKAKLLLEKLNRRTKWFAVLRGNRNSSSWGKLVPALLALFALVLIWQSFESGQVVAILMLTWALMEVYTEGVHRRVDALIELLQQEGMLGSTLPASPEKTRGDGPTDEKRENRVG